MLRNASLLLFFIALCMTAGIIGSFFTYSSVESWYLTINKPFFTPPNYLFGPVWTFLYILMGISLYLVWGNKKIKLNWFWVQLGLNIFWSIAFFGFQSPIFGLIIIVTALYAIYKTIRVFSKQNKIAAYLLYPYLAWVCFATILNLFIILLNL